MKKTHIGKTEINYKFRAYKCGQVDKSGVGEHKDSFKTKITKKYSK